MSQSRNWIFTRQSTDAESTEWTSLLFTGEPFSWHTDKRVTYCCYQIEKAPDTGKIHVQGMICFKSPCRMAAVKTLIGNEPHVEICKAPAQSRDYCRKEESRILGPWEHGDCPQGQGKKKIFKTMWDDCKANKRPIEMIENNPNVANHEKVLKFMRFTLLENQSDRQHIDMRCIISYGKTDLGKTYSAVNFIAKDGDYYILQSPTAKGNKLWFDGYYGQKYLILDDWDGSCCTIAFLKRLLDKYKLPIEIKGGYSWAVWHTIIVTSNSHPKEWFLGFNGEINETAVEPFRRRITEIRHYIARGIYQLVDWNEAELGVQIKEGEDTTTTCTTPSTVTTPSSGPLDS